MAKDDLLPDPLRKREVLWGREAKDTDHGGVGDRFLAQGRLAEALDFYERAGDAARLAALKARAIEEGDVFLLRRMSRFRSDLVSREEWRRVAQAAEMGGYTRYAIHAWGQAGEPERADALREKVASADGERALPGTDPADAVTETS